jgi:FtsH-binding integral membrane protein
MQQEYVNYGGGLRREAVIAADATPDARREFIRKTYAHLGVAVLAFVGLEWLLINSPLAPRIVNFAFGGRWNWLLFLGAFMVVGWIAEKWARSNSSPGMQYLGLALYVLLEAVFFMPLMYIAAFYARYEGVIPTAGLITAVVFAGLTAVMFLTKKDFSWLGQVLNVCFIAAFGVILASIIFGFTLGTVFCGVMVALAAGYILYTTSNIIHHYPIGSHVAASLQLFAAIALLFWYILNLLMSRR